MSTSSEVTEKTNNFPLAYLSGTYTILVATLYLWGYWSQFGINILEHLSLSDVVKAAAFPIISVFSFFALGAVLAGFFQTEGSVSSGGASTSRVDLFFKRHFRFIATTCIFLVSMFFFFGPVEKWEVLPMFIAVPLSHTLRDVFPRFSFIKSVSGQDTVRYLLVALPFFAYGHGLVDANDILKGKRYLYVSSAIQSSESKLRESPGYQLRYIGKADNRYFLYSPESSSVLIIPDSSPIELKMFRK